MAEGIVGTFVTRLKDALLLEHLQTDTLKRLIWPGSHPPHIRRHRADVIASRVRTVAAFFAIATPMWVVVDWVLFEWPTWFVLTLLRIASAVGFLALLWPQDSQKNMSQAYLMLGVLLSIPPVFYLVSHPFLMTVEGGTMVDIVVNAYSILPFVVVAGLAVFPLTVIELILFAVPAFMGSIIGAMQGGGVELTYLVNTFWLMLLVMGASGFSCLSQLNYLIQLINRASLDTLTGTFSRRSGEEIIDLQFRISCRLNMPITLCFIDLDNFKSINDSYGHEEGDAALKTMTENLRQALRRSDTVIRWGGEEFILLLPNTSASGAEPVIDRLFEHGFGMRPDGSPITASIGLSERQADDLDDWPQLVDYADTRMYMAKKRGKNRVVTVGDIEVFNPYYELDEETAKEQEAARIALASEEAQQVKGA